MERELQILTDAIPSVGELNSSIYSDEIGAVASFLGVVRATEGDSKLTLWIMRCSNPWLSVNLN